MASIRINAENESRGMVRITTISTLPMIVIANYKNDEDGNSISDLTPDNKTEVVTTTRKPDTVTMLTDLPTTTNPLPVTTSIEVTRFPMQSSTSEVPPVSDPGESMNVSSSVSPQQQLQTVKSPIYSIIPKPAIIALASVITVVFCIIARDRKNRAITIFSCCVFYPNQEITIPMI